jgi:3-oxoacyl-[acyl-carrier protein] reductase
MLVQGKTVLITGGAQGIGREMVLIFLRNGASVWYIDIQQGESLPEYEEIAKANGTKAVFKQGNVADEEGISAAAKEILKESGGIDILVNNAGITRDGLSFRMTSKDWNDVLAINLTSAFYISKVVVQDMFMKKRPGSVINVASIVGIIGNGGQVNYSASKAGLIGFTKSLAREVASRNIRVNAIAPGFIQTKMTDKLNEEQKKTLSAQIPMGRLGLPEDVAKAALFLASDLSSYITGHVVHVTGGLGM